MNDLQRLPLNLQSSRKIPSYLGGSFLAQGSFLLWYKVNTYQPITL